MGAVNRGAARRTGFVLLEVLPALAIILGFGLAGLRMVWVQLGHAAGAAEALALEGAFMEVWPAWEQGGGPVTVASRLPDGGWLLLDFPDESWLPAGVWSRETAVWRRRPGAGDSSGFWEVEVRQGPSGRSGAWRHWTRVRRR